MRFGLRLLGMRFLGLGGGGGGVRLLVLFGGVGDGSGLGGIFLGLLLLRYLVLFLLGLRFPM